MKKSRYSYPLIKLNFPPKKRGVIILIYLISIIPVCALFGWLWPPLLLFVFPLLIIGGFIIERKLSSFSIVGSLNCYEDRIIIDTENFKKTIKVKTIKGMNIEVAMGNPSLFRKYDKIKYSHKENAYSIIIKCSLTDQTKLCVYNFEDSNKRYNSTRKFGFGDILQYYSSKNHIRFWDMTGGKSGVI